MSVPRFLVVLLLQQPTSATWVAVHEGKLLTTLGAVAYWYDLYGLPERDTKQSVRIHVPRAQTFDVTAITQLITRVRR